MVNVRAVPFGYESDPEASASPLPRLLGVDERVDGTDDLPDGWVWTTIGQACELNPPKPPVDTLPSGGRVSFVSMPAVDADSGEIVDAAERVYADVRGGYTVFADGDVIMAKITPCMENGKAAIARGLTNGLAAGSSEFHVLRPNGVALAEYLFHFIRQPSFRRIAEENMTGSVGQRRVPASFLDAAAIPIPPLAEQRRIAEAVEALLAQVDAARARLEHAEAVVKRFRQAILAAACSGKLTEDWRALNPILDEAHRFLDEPHGKRHESSITSQWASRDDPGLPDTWDVVTIGQLARVGTGATPLKKRSDYYEGGTVPWVTSGAVNDRTIVRAREHITELALRATNAKVFPAGTLLVAMYGEGATRGKVAELAIPAATNQALAALTFDGPAARYKAFVRLFLEKNYEETREASLGGVQPNLSLGLIKNMPIPLPPPMEQDEIVQRVEALFGLADKLEARIRAARARVDALPQAILTRAFSGKLVPTEAELARREGRIYEPASVLLERIEAERAARGASTARKGRRGRA
ncbi:MAG: restriction endonuclease subunit S [Chloroflexota bacterium]|nr:restriction endonuclease subunit S [Chloroflexota bacterium]